MNKTILSLLCMLSVSMVSLAQEIELPQFPGGVEALSSYLDVQVKKKETASIKSIDGSVVVLFGVDNQGCIQNAIVGLSLNPICDSLALKIVEEMPAWIPGKKGQKLALSIRFGSYCFGREIMGEGLGLVKIDKGCDKEAV